ncbi:uncharacterized protein V6R79_017047 [Siganus canaliculatus]
MTLTLLIRPVVTGRSWLLNASCGPRTDVIIDVRGAGEPTHVFLVSSNLLVRDRYRGYILLLNIASQTRRRRVDPRLIFTTATF